MSLIIVLSVLAVLALAAIVWTVRLTLTDGYGRVADRHSDEHRFARRSISAARHAH